MRPQRPFTSRNTFDVLIVAVGNSYSHCGSAFSGRFDRWCQRGGEESTLKPGIRTRSVAMPEENGLIYALAAGLLRAHDVRIVG